MEGEGEHDLVGHVRSRRRVPHPDGSNVTSLADLLRVRRRHHASCPFATEPGLLNLARFGQTLKGPVAVTDPHHSR